MGSTYYDYNVSNMLLEIISKSLGTKTCIGELIVWPELIKGIFVKVIVSKCKKNKITKYICNRIQRHKKEKKNF